MLEVTNNKKVDKKLKSKKRIYSEVGGSVTERLACWTQAQ